MPESSSKKKKIESSPAVKNDPLREYEGARALVLGAGGFIGLWVSRLLSEAGAEVTTALRNGASAGLLETFGVRSEIRVSDLMTAGSLKHLISSARPSIVFNLAGYGIDRTETDEETAFKINSGLVNQVCEAVDSGPAGGWNKLRVVHAGSAMEYGAVPGNLEEDSDTRPTTVYGRSKLAGTLELQQYCERTGLKGATGRLFAIYGPGEAPSRLLPTLIGAADEDGEIELTEGLHRRDFTFVGDAAEGLLRLGMSDARPGTVVNIATGKLTSIREFTEIAAGVIGIDAERLAFGALPTRPEEMFNDAVSVSRCRSLLDWVPETSITEGIGRTIAAEITGS
ncbi:MAG: NAD(P)-dependent oxidoreductase [Acidobacteria bacterium]|nr:MAG: NAD(P)-dependent oxidoreductase [Acidobacteriota bacterium]REK01173.1 MAG: NAD(P)-dependent oxidoreductase [Acidobacteriota bacterium]REK14129.1 MAG: NAD(P)-dependent oxidoreductase [Acidobacteriota bacterium]REK44844.1 MAG: NAD(P)-dependent oxidoreductase [Acidobacteriota bacterium]